MSGRTTTTTSCSVREGCAAFVMLAPASDTSDRRTHDRPDGQSYDRTHCRL